MLGSFGGCCFNLEVFVFLGVGGEAPGGKVVEGVSKGLQPFEGVEHSVTVWVVHTGGDAEVVELDLEVERFGLVEEGHGGGGAVGERWS